MMMKLGRRAIKTDSRTLMLAKYVGLVPPPPAARDWSHGIKSWGMLLDNDSLGDCTASRYRARRFKYGLPTPQA